MLGAGRAMGLVASLLVCVGCTTLPEPKVERHEFPKNAYFNAPEGRPFKPLGEVRTKVEFLSLDPLHDEANLCQNYFNKAVRDLVKRAKDVGGDAVIDVKSVVFLVDGRRELHPRAECSDDGEGAQVLARGIAVKWLPKDGAPSAVKEHPAPEPAAPEPAPTYTPVPVPNTEPLDRDLVPRVRPDQFPSTE